MPPPPNPPRVRAALASVRRRSPPPVPGGWQWHVYQSAAARTEGNRVGLKGIAAAGPRLRQACGDHPIPAAAAGRWTARCVAVGSGKVVQLFVPAPSPAPSAQGVSERLRNSCLQFRRSEVLICGCFALPSSRSIRSEIKASIRT